MQMVLGNVVLDCKAALYSQRHTLGGSYTFLMGTCHLYHSRGYRFADEEKLMQIKKFSGCNLAYKAGWGIQTTVCFTPYPSL